MICMRYFCPSRDTINRWERKSTEYKIIVICTNHMAIWQTTPVANWTPSELGQSSFDVISFCLFIQFMSFSWQVYWNCLPFPPLMGHILSELSTMTHPSWVALHSVAYGFIELRKPLCHSKAVIHEGEQELSTTKLLSIKLNC